jgi:hypothetical protein
MLNLTLCKLVLNSLNVGHNNTLALGDVMYQKLVGEEDKA